MSEIAKPLISFVILAFLFLTPIFFIHDYAADTTSNLSSGTLTRLTEVNVRAGTNFYQTVRASMMEMNGMTKYLAQQNCGASKDEVLAVAPLFYAHGVRRFSIVDTWGKGYDGSGAQVDYSNDPVFILAREGKTHVDTAGGLNRQRLLIVANPLVVQGKIKAVIISEFPAEAIETNMETWAFGSNTYNLVMDAQGEPVFQAPPPGKSMDNLFPSFTTQGLPPAATNRLRQALADSPQSPVTFFDSDLAMFVATSPIERFGWRIFG